jgi:hypothetical protein
MLFTLNLNKPLIVARNIGGNKKEFSLKFWLIQTVLKNVFMPSLANMSELKLSFL